MGMILHTIVVHDPGVVLAGGGGGICPVRTYHQLKNTNGAMARYLIKVSIHGLWRWGHIIINKKEQMYSM